MFQIVNMKHELFIAGRNPHGIYTVHALIVRTHGIFIHDLDFILYVEFALGSYWLIAFLYSMKPHCPTTPFNGNLPTTDPAPKTNIILNTANWLYCHYITIMYQLNIV